MEAEYALAFMTGLAGGFGHCIGMCGPLVAASTLHATGARPAVRGGGLLLPQLLYHAGRISTYGMVGAVMGFAGSFVNTAGRLMGIQNAVMIIAGMIMLLMGLGVAGLTRMAWLERHNRFILGQARRLSGGAGSVRYFPFGLVMGLLPCGLSYTAFIAAAGTGTPAAGAAMMLLFGMGTVPALGLFGAAVSYLGSRVRGRIQKAGGIIVMLLGAYYIMKGIRLYAQM